MNTERRKPAKWEGKREKGKNAGGLGDEDGKKKESIEQKKVRDNRKQLSLIYLMLPMMMQRKRKWE